MHSVWTHCQKPPASRASAEQQASRLWDWQGVSHSEVGNWVPAHQVRCKLIQARAPCRLHHMADAGAGAEAARLEDALAKSEARRASAEAALARASATQDSDLAAAREAAAALRVSLTASLANHMPMCAHAGRLIYFRVVQGQSCSSVHAVIPTGRCAPAGHCQ